VLLEPFDNIFEYSEENVDANFTVDNLGGYAGLMKEW
jgi:hypothetical protein